MFCCTKKPQHYGEIVTSICTSQQCIQNQDQLCCAACIQEAHGAGHSVVTMKNMLPELLAANNEKNGYIEILNDLLSFIKEELDEDEIIIGSFGGVDKLSIFNVVHATKVCIKNLRKQTQEENKKIKQIEKTLQLKNKSGPIHTYGSAVQMNEMMKNSHFNNIHSMPIAVSQLQAPNLHSFSQTLKHPYITVSSDSLTASKNSYASGYKLAILSTAAFPLSEQLETAVLDIKVKITKSQGNIMIGLGIPSLIKSKQYINCYGSGQGAFVLGQNNNDKFSAISFHSTDTIYNRKELVGWNFTEGDIVGIGVKRQQGIYFINFKKYLVKQNGKIDYNKINGDFMMPLFNEQTANVNTVHFIVLLSALGDEVTILPPDQE